MHVGYVNQVQPSVKQLETFKIEAGKKTVKAALAAQIVARKRQRTTLSEMLRKLT